MTDEPVRGFILEPTYRYEDDFPVVTVHGVLETGESFLIRDRGNAPYFFIRTRDEDRARRLGAAHVEASPNRALFTGEPVTKVWIDRPSDAPRLRDRLLQAGLPCFEADVRYAMRYLIDRRIRASLCISGPWKPGNRVQRVYDNPAVEPAHWRPELRVLSFDIETDPKGEQLLSIALVGCGASEVLLLTESGQSCPESAIPVANEAELIVRFCQRVLELDPDVITGWNVIEFDFAVLQKVAQRHRVRFDLGRAPGAVRIQNRGGRGGSRTAHIPGRLVLDGIRLLRGSFVNMTSYALDAVAREVLGEGKVVAGKQRADEILRMFREDREKFVAYNRTDARLVLDILDKLQLIELSVERSLLTGLPPDRVTGSIAALDCLYLTELGARQCVAPTVGAIDPDHEPNAGGHVLQPEPGLHDWILVFDFRSLYPSLIRTFQIDPFGLVPRGETGDFIEAPNGARFRRQQGILTGILNDLFPRRAAAQKEGNRVASQAIKILMNSFYGVLGTPACRFHSSQLANAITSFGRELLLWSKQQFEDQGHRVLYGDTDSLFIASTAANGEEARAIGDRLCKALNESLEAHVRDTWQVESRLELQFEKVYRRLHLPAMRHSSEGARKRYVGLQELDDGTTFVDFVGMEAVRRDWTDLAHVVQREMYDRLFGGDPIPGYLRKIVEQLRNGDFDSQLVYRKSLRKDLTSYTKTTPPHVAAARKLAGPPGRTIAYVITTGGPEPVGQTQHPIDHEHYVEKQIRPIAEPILDLLGLDFRSALGGQQQLELF